MDLPSSGICYLTAAPGQPPRAEQEPADRSEEIAVCESVEVAGKPCLLMIAQGNRQLLVNALSAQCLEILHPGDEISLGSDYLMRVVLRTCPYVGLPRPADLGQICLYCRTAIGPETTTIYACVKCGRPFHCEGEEKPADQRLECAKLMTECQQCTQQVVTQESYNRDPQE